MPTAANQFKTGAVVGWVLELTDDSTTWYLSDTVRYFNNGTIQTLPLLTKHSGITNSCEPFNNSWTLSPVTVTLNNCPFKKDDNGDDVRLSNLLGAIQNKEAYLYVLLGENITELNPLTQAVRKFSMYVSDPISFNYTQCTVKLKSISELYNQPLPGLYMPVVYYGYQSDPTRYKMGATARRIFQETGTDMLPIMVGTFSNSTHGVDGLGLAVVSPISGSKNIPDLCAACHPVNAITEIWFSQENLDATYTDGLGKFDSITVSNVLSNTVVVPSSTASVRVYPAGVLFSAADISVNDETYCLGTVVNDNVWGQVIKWSAEELKAINDKTNVTSAPLLDSNDCRSEDRNNILVLGRNAVSFPCLADGSGLNLDNGIGEITGTAQIEVLWQVVGGITTPQMNIGLMYRKVDSSGDAVIWFPSTANGAWEYINFDTRGNVPGALGVFNLAADYGWDFTVNKTIPENPVTKRSPKYPLMLVFQCRVTNSSASNGIRNDKVLANIYNADLKIPYKPIGIIDFYAAGTGATFGSWIDAPGRVNDYNEGDVIEDPAYIIEYLLREHLHFTSIDSGSFDRAANANVKARINLHANNKEAAFEIIKRISEQSTFQFFFSLEGNATLAPLNDKAPTTDYIIPFSHVSKDINISKTTQIYNVLNIQHRFLQEYGGLYKDFTKISNDTSIEDYGENSQDYAWDYITSGSATHVGNHLVGNADALLANSHSVIDGLQLTGPSAIDLDIGKYFELEADSWDAQIKPFSGSWSGKQFFINSITFPWTGAAKMNGIQLY
jgi:hypothetical protein